MGPTHDHRDGKDQIGPYRILRPLGRGGMGTVYEAVHHDTNARHAVKTVRVPDANLLMSLRREIHALARLRHPGIVRIVEHLALAPLATSRGHRAVDPRAPR